MEEDKEAERNSGSRKERMKEEALTRRKVNRKQ